MSGKRGKNDAADAAAICEAVTRPSMRFVPLKDEYQPATLCPHRTRQGFVEERTAIYNRLRGLLSEFGVIVLTVQILAVVARRPPSSKGRQFGGFRTIGGSASH
jgi:transposase